MKGATSSLRLLAEYLYHKGILQQNLACHVPKVKVKPDGIPSVYTPDESQAMLEHFSHSNPVDDTCTDTTRIYLKIDIGHMREFSLDVPPFGDIWMGGAPV